MSLLLGYGLTILGVIILLFAFGFTGIVSNYVKFQPPKRRATPFGIYFWSGMLLVMVGSWVYFATWT